MAGVKGGAAEDGTCCAACVTDLLGEVTDVAVICEKLVGVVCASVM